MTAVSAAAPRSRLLLPLLVASAMLGLLASAIYVPSIPDMARDFGSPVGAVQATLSVFLVAFAGGMLVLGPLSDRYGRRRVLLAGMVVCFVSSLACTLAPSLWWLIVLRVPQALGACAGMVVARAIVRDLYDRAGAAQVMAAIAMAVTLAPALAPLLGGQIHTWLGWRANFAFVTLFCALVAALAWWRLPETHRPSTVEGSLLGTVMLGYARLARERAFFGYSLAIMGGAGCFYGFVAEGPVILIDRLGVPPDRYGLYAAIPPLGFIMGSFISNRTTRRVGIDRLIRIGSIVAASAGFLMAALALSPVGGPLAVAGPMLLIGFGNGLMMPNAFAGSISIHPDIAGAAAGLAGFFQMMGAALATVAATLLPAGSAVALGLLLAGLGLLAAIGFRVLVSPAGRPG